jgi:hypothetical protein
MTVVMKVALAASVVALFIQTPAAARNLHKSAQTWANAQLDQKPAPATCADIAAPPSNPTRVHSNINAHPSRSRK